MHEGGRHRGKKCLYHDTVRNTKDRLVFYFGEKLSYARLDVCDAFPAGWYESVGIALPCSPLMRPLRGNLLMGLTLPVAVVDLGKARVTPDRFASRNDLGGLERALQRARINALERRVLQPVLQGFSLLPACGVQRDIQPSLIASFGIPVREAVSDKNQSPALANAACHERLSLPWLIFTLRTTIISQTSPEKPKPLTSPVHER